MVRARSPGGDRRLRRSLKAIWSDPKRFEYRDVAITPPDLDELSLSLYAETRGTAAAIEKDKRQQDIRRTARNMQHVERVPLAAAE